MDEKKVEQAIQYAHDVGFDEGYEVGWQEGFEEGTMSHTSHDDKDRSRTNFCKWCALNENEYGELWGPKRYIENLESYACITQWPGESMYLMVIEHKSYDETCIDTGLMVIHNCPWCGRRL